MTKYYSFGEYEFKMYQAASGDYCVSVEQYGQEREDYNLGTLEKAYEHILSYALIISE